MPTGPCSTYILVFVLHAGRELPVREEAGRGPARPGVRGHGVPREASEGDVLGPHPVEGSQDLQEDCTLYECTHMRV